jgi:hypothetical protein
MKTLSGTVKFVVFPAIAIGAAIALHGFAQTPTPIPTEPPDPPDPTVSQEPLSLRIKPRRLLADPSPAGETAFKTLLNNGNYPAAKGNKIHMRHKKWPSEKDEYLPTGAGPSSKLDIKTDKVTASETAKNIEAEELTVIGPHVTIQVASSSPTDIKKVLDLLAP